MDVRQRSKRLKGVEVHKLQLSDGIIFLYSTTAYKIAQRGHSFICRSEVDDLHIPKVLLKGMCAWPEDGSKVDRTIQALFQASPIAYLIPVTIYGFTEAAEDGLLQFMQAFTDWLALFSIVAKDYFIRRNAREILPIRKLLTHDFKMLEKMLHVSSIRTKRQLWPWGPTIVFIGVVWTNVFVTLYTMLAGREHRVTMMRVPAATLDTDYLYFPLVADLIICGIASGFTYASADGLFIVFTTVLRDKAGTLIEALGDIRKQQRLEELDETLTYIVRYHQLICRLHKTTELLCSGQVVVMVSLVFFSIGILLLRLLYVDLPLGEAVYMIFYLSWVFGQLNTYCMLGESVTHSCLAIANAAYFAYRPEMHRSAAEKLRFVLLRAQRPLKMTGLGLITMNRKIFLEVLKRSYSFCSAILKLK